MLPFQFAVEVVAVQADIAEQHVQMLAVGGGRFRGERVLDVVRLGRDAVVRIASPHDRSIVEVQADDLPLVLVLLGRILVGVDVLEIEPLARLGILARVDAGGQKDALTPHDRRRPAQAGQIGFPGDVFGRAPVVRRQRLRIGGGLATGKKERDVGFGPRDAASGTRNRGREKCMAQRRGTHRKCPPEVKTQRTAPRPGVIVAESAAES